MKLYINLKEWLKDEPLTSHIEIPQFPCFGFEDNEGHITQVVGVSLARDLLFIDRWLVNQIAFSKKDILQAEELLSTPEAKALLKSLG